MCTVTVVPRASGFRLVCNRDELRSRRVADPPRCHRLAHGVAMWPIDPDGGGTWIAVNDTGLVLALLNRTGATVSPRHATSRGTLIPRLIDAPSLAAAMDSALGLDVQRFSGFTLVAVQGNGYASLTWLDRRLTLRMERFSSPLFFTSSSLGDEVVTAPRMRLFAEMVVSNIEPLAGQAAFHSHRWPSRQEISVEMSRADARTVSRTVVDVHRDAIRMRYVPLRSDDWRLRASA